MKCRFYFGTIPKGQVIDSSMVDGSAALMTLFFTLRGYGMFTEERGAGLLDGGAHFYDTYETADEKYIAIGAIEPQFYRQLLEKTGSSSFDVDFVSKFL